MSSSPIKAMAKPETAHPTATMDPRLITYYEAIERASAEMLDAARAGDWDQVVKLEGACVLLISRLKQASEANAEDDAQADAAAARDEAAAMEAARTKSRIMQRILVNDAEIRQLAEPWLADLDAVLDARPRTLH
jgi:flagellar protein FliT